MPPPHESKKANTEGHGWGRKQERKYHQKTLLLFLIWPEHKSDSHRNAKLAVRPCEDGDAAAGGPVAAVASWRSLVLTVTDKYVGGGRREIDCGGMTISRLTSRSRDNGPAELDPAVCRCKLYTRSNLQLLMLQRFPKLWSLFSKNARIG